uniref:Transcriptional regulator n=1 Tax=Loa loa TaxID=7209 RepID=A0A1I7VFV3_LOALO
MSEHKNHELNRRRGILHYRDGEINPPYLKNALKGIDETNFTAPRTLRAASLETT